MERIFYIILILVTVIFILINITTIEYNSIGKIYNTISNIPIDSTRVNIGVVLGCPDSSKTNLF